MLARMTFQKLWILAAFGVCVLGVARALPRSVRTTSAAFVTSQSHAGSEKLASVADDGTVLALTEVKTTVGQLVFLTSGRLASQAAAQRELETRVRASSQILKRGFKKNDTGSIVGERVLALLHNRDPHQERTSWYGQLVVTTTYLAHRLSSPHWKAKPKSLHKYSQTN